MALSGMLRREFEARWALYLTLAGTVVVYADAMNSPLYGDDYIYLYAARELSFGEFARAAFTPWGNEPLLPFTRDFWRPFAFLWFEVSEPVFGGSVVPYHLANLAIHLLSVGLVWALAGRLDARRPVRALATNLFALHPGSFEAVTWISSVNSAGLPLALGAWLAFLAGTKARPDVAAPDTAGVSPPRPRWRWIVVSAGLLVLALCFRETSVALVPAMALWYLLVEQRERLFDRRTYVVFVPIAVVALVYYLIRTRGLTEPFANPDIYAFDSDYPERFWYYMRNALLPFRDPVTGWRIEAQHVAGIVLAGFPFVAIRRRRWDLVALSVGLIISIVPLGAAVLGQGQRYFYFSTPILALLLGKIGADVMESVSEQRERLKRAALPAAVAAIVVAGSSASFSRIDHWQEIGPEPQQRWVDGLRAAHPKIPDGGTLYCANVPFILALFGAANLEPTVRWYYPELGAVVYHTALEPPPLGANDRFFDPGTLGVTVAQP